MIYTAQNTQDETLRDKVAATALPLGIRCLVSASDESRCEELRRQIRRIRRPRIFAEFTPPRNLLSTVRSYRPQVVVLEIDRADADPLAVTKNLRAFQPEVPVLISTGRRDAILASRLLRSGAQGYILHSDWRQEGARALGLLAEGSCFVSECVMQDILQHLGDLQPAETTDGLDVLTDRELIVFQFLGLGHHCSQIARELHVTPRTVATHRTNIKRKMNLETDEDLIASAQHWINQRNG